jgi:amino-acid N-acetyltransferase
VLPAGMTTVGRGEGPPVRIRDATPPDLSAVHRLIGDAGLPLEGLTDAAVVLVADVDDTVVGAAALERHGIGPDTVFLLRSAVVDPAKRGLGIGTLLTVAALERVDAAVAPVALLTETAEGYFPRFGFTQVDRGELPAALQASEELRGACPTSAQALMRRARS